MTEAAIGILSAIIGFLGKSAWDLFWKQRQERIALAHKKRIDFLENQLSRFFWPIYIRLQKDNVVWERILDRSKGKDDLRAKVGYSIETKFLLPNHEETVRTKSLFRVRQSIGLTRICTNLYNFLFSNTRGVSDESLQVFKKYIDRVQMVG